MLTQASYGEPEGSHMPVVAIVLLAGSFLSYAACFALAASTKRLRVSDYLVGTLGVFCGVGSIYFLYRANAVTLEHSFELVEQGRDPAEARAVNQRFRIAAGLAIAFAVACMLLR